MTRSYWDQSSKMTKKIRPIRSNLGRFFGHFGPHRAFLGLFWGPSWAILGPSWGHLEACCGHLGVPNRVTFDSFWGVSFVYCFWTISGSLLSSCQGPFFAYKRKQRIEFFVRLLEALWKPLDDFGGRWRLCGGLWRLFWSSLKAVWRLFGCFLEA